MTQNTQPVRVAPGGRYGSRKALESAQKAIPLPAGGIPARAAPGEGIPVVRPDVFGPTNRPNEPVTAGAQLGPGPSNLGVLPDDPGELLRILNTMFPSPGTRRMIERMSRGQL
jgi:hypothetical protein